MFPSSIKRDIRRFHVRSRAVDVKDMYYALYVLIILHEFEFLTKCWGAL